MATNPPVPTGTNPPVPTETNPPVPTETNPDTLMDNYPDAIDGDRWERLKKLLNNVDEQAQETDTVEERAQFLYAVIKSSEYFGGIDVFPKELLIRLSYDFITEMYKQSKKKYGAANVRVGSSCADLSEKVFGIDLNNEAMVLVPDLMVGDLTNDDGIDNGIADDIQGEADDDDAGERLYDYINLLPTSDEVVSKSVQTTQHGFFPKVKALYDESKPMPEGEDRQTEGWKNHTLWTRKVSQEENEMNEKLPKGTPPWGHIPLSALAQLWTMSRGGTEVQKKVKREMSALWLKNQFPLGWTRMPPEDDNKYPSQETLLKAMEVKLKLEQDLARWKEVKKAREDKGAASGHNQAQSRDPALGAYNQNTIHNNVHHTVPGPNQKHVLQLRSRRVESGKLEPNSNKTEDGEPIKAFWSRETKYKDDEAEDKVVTKKFNYYVVEKLVAGSQHDRFYEIMGEELCGGREVQNAVNRATVPRLTEKAALDTLPTKKQITAISWGLNWIAAWRKYKEKKGLPGLVVNMWWLEKTAELRTDFKKSVDRTKPLERCVVLARGHYCALMGPRGDKMIMKSIPHPQGFAWANVKECISYCLQVVDS